MHMLRSDAPHFLKFGEICFSTAYPGVTKGWHEHNEINTKLLCSFRNDGKLVLFDNVKT